MLLSIIWVLRSPVGWGRLAEALGGVVEVRGKLLALFGITIGIWKSRGREDTGK